MKGIQRTINAKDEDLQVIRGCASHRQGSNNEEQHPTNHSAILMDDLTIVAWLKVWV
jgi:hypothetical protein